jgi:hypothetical protein
VIERGYRPGLADFSSRTDHPKNGPWTTLHGDQIVGAIAIDGQDPGPDVADLDRWPIAKRSADC